MALLLSALSSSKSISNFDSIPVAKQITDDTEDPATKFRQDVSMHSFKRYYFSGLVATFALIAKSNQVTASKLRYLSDLALL